MNTNRDECTELGGAIDCDYFNEIKMYAGKNFKIYDTDKDEEEV